MTKEQLLEMAVSRVNLLAFGGEIVVKQLTIKEAGEVAKLEGFDGVVLAVHYALVEPAMSVDELNKLPSALADDFAKIIEAIS